MKQIIAVLLCWTTSELFSQVDTSKVLPTVTIETMNVVERQGVVNTWQCDSLIARLHQWDALSQVLSSSGLVFVRANGNGALATINLRGTGASHTQVLWQGGAFQNPMNGVADMSLIPAGHFGRVAVMVGGVSAAVGSGGIGGAIVLSPDAITPKPFGFDIGVGVGSFGIRNLKVGMNSRWRSWSQQTSYINRFAQNNILFRNNTLVSRPLQRLENARFLQHSIVHEARWQPSNKHVLKLSAWAMTADRALAPSMTESNNHAKQNDRRLQLAVNHSWAMTNRVGWQNRLSYTFEDLVFESDVIVPSLSKAQAWQYESLLHLPIKTKVMADIGAKIVSQAAFAPEYIGDKARHRNFSEAFVTLRYNLKNLSIISNIRQGITDSAWQPLQPALTFEYRKKGTRVAAKAARHFAQPTLNDLYWSDGVARGNAALLPELGWAFEVGIQQRLAGEIQFDATMYSSSLQNWIQWIQKQGIWEPQNVKSVWSRGLELGAMWQHGYRQIKTTHSIRGNSVIATNTETYFGNNQTVGKQLIYTPRFSATGLHSLGWQLWQMTYQHQIVGRRYTTTDNESWLPLYYTADLALLRDFKLKKYRLETSVSCKNMYNAAYQVMAFRPMPGRHVVLSINVLY